MSSDAKAILGRLTQLGCRVTAQGSTLRVEARSPVPAPLLQAAREHKADLLDLVAPQSGQDRLVRMPLDEFARVGAPLEIRVPWWPHTLWFVPDEHHAGLLEADGITRGRIWTAGELVDLMAARDQPGVPMVALAKLEFAGEVVEVRPRG